MAKKHSGSTKRRSRCVADIMVTDVVSIDPTASLSDAARTMETANVGMLPVLDDGRLIGVITDRDIVVRAIAREADPAATAVGDALTGDAIVASPDWTADQALQTMAQAQIGRLPVLDEDGRLVGVVTLSSIAFRSPEQEETLEAAQEVSRRSERKTA